MTLAGSPALDLAIASLTGRGRASAADSKIFKNSLGSSSLFAKDYLPPTYLSSTSPTLSLPTQYHPVHSESVVLFISLRENLFLRQEEEVPVVTRSSSSSSQHPSGIACSQHLFFFSYGHSSSSSSLVPAPSVRRLSQPGPAPKPSTHQICLPDPTRRFRFVRLLSARPNTPTNDACCLRRIVVRAVGPRLSIRRP